MPDIGCQCVGYIDHGRRYDCKNDHVFLAKSVCHRSSNGFKDQIPQNPSRSNEADLSHSVTLLPDEQCKNRRNDTAPKTMGYLNDQQKLQRIKFWPVQLMSQKRRAV